jgi:hypothetical protein
MSKARVLAIALNGLLQIMRDDEIVKLLSPKNVKGGLEILRKVGK